MTSGSAPLSSRTSLTAARSRAVPAALTSQAQPGSSFASREYDTAARWMIASGATPTALRTDSPLQSSSGTTRTSSVQSRGIPVSAVLRVATTSSLASRSVPTRALPLNPWAHVTIKFTEGSFPGAQALEVRVYHHGDQLWEPHLRRATQLLAGLGWVGQQKIHLGR